MTPFHYAIVQARDPSIGAERRNVGLLVLSPTLGKAWLRRGDLKQRAHLIGDDAAFVRALLDLLADEASEVAREGSAAAVHGWLRARSRPNEDSLVLAQPAMGVAEDLSAEIGRLRERYLGRAGRSGRSSAEKVRDEVLRAKGLREAFHPRAFESGPATWKFPFVADVGRHPVVLNALSFTQRKPESVLDAAFHNIGRAGEVRAWHGDVRWVTIATGPASGDVGRGFTRACEVMRDAGLHVVPPEHDRVVAELVRAGVLGRGSSTAEA